jgi:hypothetical protein
MSTPRINEKVGIKDLVSRADLNGRAARIVKWHPVVGRWEVLLVAEVVERVRLRRENFSRDCITFSDEEGSVTIEWPEWPDKKNATASATKLLAARCKQKSTFTGVQVTLHLSGEKTRALRLPWLVINAPTTECWDANDLLTTLPEMGVPASIRIVRTEMDWTAPTDAAFSLSVASIIQQAHADSNLLQLVFRTPRNTPRFALFQTLACNDERISLLIQRAATAGEGTIFCDPTDALALHKDNLIRLPSSLTAEKASRKIVEMLEVGCEGQICPICLEDMAWAPSIPVFMPCPCKASVHLECLRSIQSANGSCPLCRQPFAV